MLFVVYGSAVEGQRNAVVDQDPWPEHLYVDPAKKRMAQEYLRYLGTISRF